MAARLTDKRKKFQSTHPARGATAPLRLALRRLAPFQSTHPARGATWQRIPSFHLAIISIHAPREGCDGGETDPAPASDYFNPRTPRGVRPLSVVPQTNTFVFQSTHPARGATLQSLKIICPMWYFNPRTPRGVRPSACWVTTWSIYGFQSTHPARGATDGGVQSDADHRNFNPRTPRGVRRSTPAYSPGRPGYFNPRTPRGVRHLDAVPGGVRRLISIHAPREGCDGVICSRWAGSE